MRRPAVGQRSEDQLQDAEAQHVERDHQLPPVLVGFAQALADVLQAYSMMSMAKALMAIIAATRAMNSDFY